MDLEPIRVLLVEDNRGDARLLRELLFDSGSSSFLLEYVECLRDAVERLTIGPCDVVLLDLSLGDSSGLETLRRVHACSPHVPVVVLTGVDDEMTALRAVQEGAQDFLVKGSVDGNLLVRSMRYAIERHRMIAELEMARRQEHYVATHDMLTALPNRQLFHDRLEQALAEARRNRVQVAVLFLDLDRFKNINDTLGHAAGDRLIQAVSRRILECIRETDTAARLGGDEFTVVLPGIRAAQDVTPVAEKLLRAFEKEFVVDGRELFVTPSIGISMYPSDGPDADTLLRSADVAMYRAKGSGRNTFQFYLPAMNAQAAERLDLERALRLALERDEFVLHYQPQIDLTTHRVIGMEALIRWRHPELGLLAPGRFIPLAEETGLILPIGEWVLRAACAQNRAWQEAGLPEVTLAVNFSARQFQQEDPVAFVRRCLRDSGLPPRSLELEITESVLMTDVEASADIIHRLREIGVQVSMDDFGTGYSSLSYLKRFPLEKLKIDQIFVQACSGEPRDRAIISAIVGLAHSLHMKPLAEGVETTKQLRTLRSLRCHAVQGFLISRPLSAEDAGAFLKGHSPRSRTSFRAEKDRGARHVRPRLAEWQLSET